MVKLKRSPLAPPWEGKNKHFRLLFEAFALLLDKPVKTVADLLGEHDRRLWRMLEGYVREAYEQLDFSIAEVIGCDELSARKGHKCLSVFAELRERAVLFVTGRQRPPQLGSVYGRVHQA